MIEFRKNHPILRSMRFYSGEKKKGYTTEDISWRTPENKKPDWSDDDVCIAVLINGAYAEELFLLPDSDFYMMFNPSGSQRLFKIPETPSGRRWKISINTSADEWKDIFPQGGETLLNGNEVSIPPHSLIVLTAY
jgi:glycogen operon protein